MSRRVLPMRLVCCRARAPVMGVSLALLAGLAQADPALPKAEAAVWLQKMADASRRMAYEGSFVVQHGNAMHTLYVSNRPINSTGKESRLMAMDGIQREVRCSETGSLSVVADGGRTRLERRLNSRHFPDLLPLDAGNLANWYAVRLGEFARVAGLDCRQVELVPKDAFRWGYVLCAEKESGLPLKAVTVDDAGQPLMQYAFVELKLGGPSRPAARMLPADAPPAARPVETERVSVRNMPPGYARVTAVRRTLPNKPGEVEHWVFSDGLTHISLFLEPASKPVESVKGQSDRGMIHLLTRQIGPLQATVVGDAPWPAVEAIAMGLEARR